jgi:hypothetical protein
MTQEKSTELSNKEINLFEQAMYDLCYSRNGETYYDLESFIDIYGDELEPGDVIYEAEQVRKSASAYLGRYALDSIFESMSSCAFEDVGECVPDSWPDLGQDKRDELRRVVGDWLDANVRMHFWGIRKDRELTLTAEWIAENTATVPAGVKENSDV